VKTKNITKPKPSTGEQMRLALLTAQGGSPLATDEEVTLAFSMRELMTLRSVISQNHAATDDEIDDLFRTLTKHSPDSLDKLLRPNRMARWETLKRHRSKVERLMERVNFALEQYDDDTNETNTGA
jgi:hypothetical protein